MPYAAREPVCSGWRLIDAVTKKVSMSKTRRDFMKMFGISLGSLLLTRCQRTGTPEPTYILCYAPIPYTPISGTATPESISGRDRLRLCWLRFDELAQKTQDAANRGGGDGDENPVGTQMNADHRSALDELVTAGDITAPVADLIQEAFSAAVYHVWRSNAPMTCYEPMMIDYAPASAGSLVQQSEILAEIAAGTPIAPETISKAQTALEHDLAFYALTDADVQALYDQLLEEYRDSYEGIPSFEEIKLSLSPDVKQAAKFLIDILMGR
jgi:hypothetical protein